MSEKVANLVFMFLKIYIYIWALLWAIKGNNLLSIVVFVYMSVMFVNKITKNN